MPSYMPMPPQPRPTCIELFNHDSSLLLAADFTSFTSLTSNLLTSVANTFAFVGLRLTNSTDICCHLTNQLLIDTTHANLGRLRCRICPINRESDASRRLNLNRMRITNQNDQIIASFCSTIAHTMDLQLLCIAIRHPNNHIIEEGTIETMFSLVLLTIRGTAHLQRPILKLEC